MTNLHKQCVLAGLFSAVNKENSFLNKLSFKNVCVGMGVFGDNLTDEAGVGQEVHICRLYR